MAKLRELYVPLPGAPEVNLNLCRVQTFFHGTRITKQCGRPARLQRDGIGYCTHHLCGHVDPPKGRDRRKHVKPEPAVGFSFTEIEDLL